MKASFAILSLFMAAASASQLEVTPVQKVIALMGGMLEKGKKEKHAEQLMFATSRQYCGDQETSYGKAIKGENQAISGLTATISKATADAGAFGKKIVVLTKDEDTWTSDKKAATKVRNIEKADYAETHKDYSESIDALSRAVAMMKKQSFDRKQNGASLAQIQPAVGSLIELGLIPEKAKRQIDLFLQQGEEQSALVAAAPQANGYEFQAKGVVDMLEKLQDKFIDEKTNLEKEEANAKHSYAMLVQDLDAQVAQAEKDINEKTGLKAGRMQVKADGTGDKKIETGMLNDDSQSLGDLKVDCTMKAADFENRQKLRTSELQEIAKAMEILSSGSVAGNARKHLPALMQAKKATMLGQLRNSENSKAQDKVAQFLQAQAKKFGSRVLATVAARAAADPFAKVKKMLKDLVVRLMEEANEESSHKGWCDTELSTNAQTRKEKSEGVETLGAAIDELGASIAKLTDDIKDLNTAVAGINSAIAQATTARNEENKANTDTIKDAADAQTALAQATTVLKEFYSNSAQATSLLQQPNAYKGMQEENGGVTAMLEVIESDFARLEADTKANEATAEKQFDKFMTDSKTDKASKSTAIEHKAAKKQDEAQALTGKKTDLEETQKSLDAALSYFDKMKPSCVDAGVSFDDRVQRRKEEIESLQEALKVLDGEDIA